MRRLILLSLALLPTACNQYHFTLPSKIGGGRGIVNPPTIEEMRQIKCLATMVYGEARGEVEYGQVAVAYTALNRAAKKTVCDVVLAPKQYSIFNNNPALKAAAMSSLLLPRQKNIIDNESWQRAMKVASAVIRKEVIDPTMGSTHYLADRVMRQKGYKYPKWSKEFQLTAVIDNHKFYKLVDKHMVRL